MKDEDGKPQASFFFVYYSKDGADPAKRPITFAFNGGPGSSSVWLHMGAFGPKRVAYSDDEGRAAKPPYHLVDNENSLLDITDIIFIDPVTTGFSRAIPVKEDAKYPRSGRRHSVGRRLHPAADHALQPLVLTEVPGRRKLRHHTRGRAGRLSHRTRATTSTASS